MSSTSPVNSPQPPTVASREPRSDALGGATVETLRERLAGALPLFLVGGACVLLSVYLYLMRTVTTFGGSSSTHLQPWILFVALGITGLAAGTFALLFDEEARALRPRPRPRSSSPPSTPRKPKPNRLFGGSRANYPGPTPEERVRLPGAFTEASPSPTDAWPMVSAPSPVGSLAWDESPPAPLSPKETLNDPWDESPQAFEAGASRPASADVVLRQLDDMELSLRKKTAPARSD